MPAKYEMMASMIFFPYLMGSAIEPVESAASRISTLSIVPTVDATVVHSSSISVLIVGAIRVCVCSSGVSHLV